jgi:RsmE family RNA methyltransferase
VTDSAAVNLLLLHAHELQSNGGVTLEGRRAEHVHEVLRAQIGQQLRVGIKGGRIGTGEIVTQSKTRCEMLITLTSDPLSRPHIDVIVAIPRPKALKRVIPALASLGVDSIFFVGAKKVEKSYFDSKVLTPEFIEGLIDLGLEQAQDTVAPTVEIHERLTAFLRERLPLIPSGKRILCHPSEGEMKVSSSQRILLAIGPDGGWTDDEVKLFANNGFENFGLGSRTLRVEVAIPAVIGALRPHL